MSDLDVPVGDRVLSVRDVGEHDAPMVLHFHGTPSSRLELSGLDDVVRRCGVRLVTFDRPGYGRSTPAPYGVQEVTDDALAVADALGVGRFAVCGQSGGGPFALACGAMAADRVTAVGVASGAGPFQLVPGAVQALDETDAAALAHLPGDRAAAVATLETGCEPIRALLAGDDEAVAVAFGSLMSPRDLQVLARPALRASFVASTRESLRQGTSGYAYDNLTWLPDWSFDLADVHCPVHLWYGTDDRFAPLAHGRYLADHLPAAHLTVREGYGHLGIMEHLDDVLSTLTGAGAR